MKQAYRSYFFALFITTACTFLCVAGLNLFVDPFGVWRAEPLVNYDRVIANYSRLARTLQVAVRQPKLVFIGSSRVFFGLDPAAVDPGLAKVPLTQIYNMGITSLQIYEANAFLSYLLKRTPVEHVVYGLDYFAFSQAKHQPGFDEDTPSSWYLYKAFLQYLFGYGSTKSSLFLLTNPTIKPFYGRWTHNGFYEAHKSMFFKALLRRRGKPDHRTAEPAPTHSKLPLEEALNYFSVFLAKAKHANIKLSLYISPLGSSLKRDYKKRGIWEQYQQWKQAVGRVALQYGYVVYDFDDDNPITLSPFDSKAEVMANPYYYNDGHFTPKVGKMILAKLNLSTPPADMPEHFGHPLV